MANDRITQIAVEVVLVPNPAARLTQMAVEAVVAPPINFKPQAIVVVVSA